MDYLMLTRTTQWTDFGCHHHPDRRWSSAGTILTQASDAGSLVSISILSR